MAKSQSLIQAKAQASDREHSILHGDSDSDDEEDLEYDIADTHDTKSAIYSKKKETASTTHQEDHVATVTLI
jgi:hypothetical protein